MSSTPPASFTGLGTRPLSPRRANSFLGNRPPQRAGSLPPVPAAQTLANAAARGRTQSSEDVAEQTAASSLSPRAQHMTRGAPVSPLALVSSTVLEESPPSPTMPPPTSLPSPPPLPTAGDAPPTRTSPRLFDDMPDTSPQIAQLINNSSPRNRPASLEMAPTSADDLRRSPLNVTRSPSATLASAKPGATAARALGRNARVIYGSSDSITLPVKSSNVPKTPLRPTGFPVQFTTATAGTAGAAPLPPPPSASLASIAVTPPSLPPPPPHVEPGALTSALSVLHAASTSNTSMPRTAPIAISGADTTLRLAKQPSSIPALSNPRSSSPVTKLVIGSLTPQRYCSPEPQPMPAFEDIPEGHVYDPDFLFTLIESASFAKPAAATSLGAASQLQLHTAALSSPSSVTPLPSPPRNLPAGTEALHMSANSEYSNTKGGSLGRNTGTKPLPPPLPAPNFLPAPPAPPESISLFDLVAPEKLDFIRMKEADRPRDPTISRKSMRLSLMPARSSLDSLFSMDHPPLPLSLPETMQTAAPPVSIVSEEEISLAEVESLRAQVQAIDEAAVPQPPPSTAAEPEPDLDKELTEMVEMSATVSLDDAQPADKQAEVDWLLADDDDESDDGWGLPEDEILKNRLWHIKEDDEWERTLKAMEEDATERLRDEMEDEEEILPPTNVRAAVVHPEPEHPKKLLLKGVTVPSRPDTPIRSGTPLASRSRSDSAMAVLVRPSAKR